jgi:hypothetical protein
MELLLNLAWLLLAVPAYWLWRDSRTGKTHRRSSAAQCLFALACMLVVLFPVVSATDDLRAMRAELEESPSGKRSLCQRGGEKASSSKLQTQPFLLATSAFAVATSTAWNPLPSLTVFVPELPATRAASRAPPSSQIA